MNRNKALVIGGSGFIGSYVCDELLNNGYEVHIADLQKSEFFNEEFIFHQLDILDKQQVDQIMSHHKFVVIYNFAGFAQVGISHKHPQLTFELNVMGNLNILNSIVEHKQGLYIYASSAYAASDKGSFYGISKYTSEKVIAEFNKIHDLDFIIIRYGSLYGERAKDDNGIYRLLQAAIQNKVIQHKGTGEETREYIHAIDAAKLSVDVIGQKDLYNEHLVLTGVERFKYKDLLAMIEEIFDYNIDIEYLDQEIKGHYKVTPYNYRPTTAKKLVANPFIDLGQGIVDCIYHLEKKL
ncbi:MAG: NAD-dependent epimerase/dehydratase family protein [Candidatus Cloacimonetes bacterium]|nr:NAD-dependent epimerase/dehydratase family protein [Candidatus Cloacimonadota bacterium]